jgi:hypothetical protein
MLPARHAASEPKRHGINELLTPSGSGARKRSCRATVQIFANRVACDPPAFRENQSADHRRNKHRFGVKELPG